MTSPATGSKFDVAVAGGGPAGLSCAYTLAKRGFKVVVLERGRTPGGKNLFGGRVYSSPLEKVYENFRKEAPIERWVKRERMSMMAEDGTLSIDYNSNMSTSFTTYLSKLVAWMASKAESQGAVVVTDVRVDEVLMEDGRAVGVVAGGDRLYADVVVVAEGANRLLCEKMNIVPALSPGQVALGMKQVVRLGAEKINERFGLGTEEGLAWFFLGKASAYLPGGAFLYTNSSAVTLGIVLYLEEGMRMPEKRVYEILEDFRTSPQLGRLLDGGSLVEYGSHLIPEGGLKMMPRRLYGDGYVIVGDATGLILNLGYTVRGVDFAVHCGHTAAQAIIEAHSSGGYGSANLSGYQRRLNESIVIREMRRHRMTQEMMRSPQVFDAYPRMMVDMAKRLYEFGEASPKLLEAGRSSMKGRRSTFGMLRDLLTLAGGP
jgi:electron transfer flavoprotein-quinone oxidoreductase